MEQTKTKEFIKWVDSDYSVGINIIDDHHKVLLGLINEIYQSFMERKHLTVTAEVLGKLEEYARFHFAFEERIFNQIGYALAKEHIVEHRAFTTQIAIYKTQVATGVDATFSISNYLRGWLLNHISKEDKKYAPLFKKAGII